jgi:hypothetical protein
VRLAGSQQPRQIHFLVQPRERAAGTAAAVPLSPASHPAVSIAKRAGNASEVPPNTPPHAPPVLFNHPRHVRERLHTTDNRRHRFSAPGYLVQLMLLLLEALLDKLLHNVPRVRGARAAAGPAPSTDTAPERDGLG